MNNSETKFWMVWNPKRDTPAYQHHSHEAAVSEAERLARLNPGQRFYVLEATDLRVVDAMVRQTLDVLEIPF